VLVQAPADLESLPPSPLFPRLDDAAQQAIVVKVVGDAAVAAGTPAPAAAPKGKPAKAAPLEPLPVSANQITFDEFSKIELRVGRVVTAIAVPKAKKLLHLTVDLGEVRPRSIVAGIAEAYTPEQMTGRQVLVVANLAPTTIRGITSEGMILAGGDDQIVGLSGLDRDAPPGTRVR
jgi:methionyl-tRNA synthetase